MAQRNAMRIGTRGSRLARWQADAVAAALATAGHGPCEIVDDSNDGGDRFEDRPRSAAIEEGKRVFVKEIEEALLGRRRSTSRSTARKTCRSICRRGLAIGAVLPREDPRDAIVLGRPPRDSGPGTGTLQSCGRVPSRQSLSLAKNRHRRLRRVAQLRAACAERALRAEYAATSTRGCASWTPGQFDALVLAAAGFSGSGSAIASRR